MCVQRGRTCFRTGQEKRILRRRVCILPLGSNADWPLLHARVRKTARVRAESACSASPTGSGSAAGAAAAGTRKRTGSQPRGRGGKAGEAGSSAEVNHRRDHPGPGRRYQARKPDRIQTWRRPARPIKTLRRPRGLVQSDRGPGRRRLGYRHRLLPVLRRTARSWVGVEAQLPKILTKQRKSMGKHLDLRCFVSGRRGSRAVLSEKTKQFNGETP